MFLKSTKVQVYPSAYRDKNEDGDVFNPEARIPSEFNITTAINSLMAQQGFVIDWNSSTHILKCNIYGYYFKLDLSDVLSSFSNSIWAYIDLKDRGGSDDVTNTDYPDTSLKPLNGNENGLDIVNGISYDFVGIELEENEPTTFVHRLKLLENDNGWKVPDASKLIYSTEQIKDTDGKSIDKEFKTGKLTVTGGSSDVILPDKSINTNEIADNAITNSQIAYQTITEDEIANNAITTNKILDASITSAKIDRGEVKTVNLDTGAVTTTKINTGAVTKAKLDTSVFDALYPVGSIYMSTTRIEATAITIDKWGCPLASLWTSSKWEKLEGRFLLGAGTSTDADYKSNTYTVGNPGGYADAHVIDHNHYTNKNDIVVETTLSDNHNHTIQTWVHDTAIPDNMLRGYLGGGDTGTLTLGSGSSIISMPATKGQIEVRNQITPGTYQDAKSFRPDPALISDNNGEHKHSITISKLTSKTGDAGISGVGRNMPPYLVVYMWKRTA